MYTEESEKGPKWFHVEPKNAHALTDALLQEDPGIATVVVEQGTDGKSQFLVVAISPQKQKLLHASVSKNIQT